MTTNRKKGGIQAAKTNKERHGEDFYRNIGKKGGSKTTEKLKGFAHMAANDPNKQRSISTKGGKNPYRGKKK